MFPKAENDWDKNMISAKIIVKTNAFCGEYEAELMTVDFEKFKQELRLLYQELDGHASFECLEHYLSIQVQGDGLGHFTADCIANEKPWINDSELRCKFYFDQTQINDLVYQLDLITKEFPIVGDFKIKNE